MIFIGLAAWLAFVAFFLIPWLRPKQIVDKRELEAWKRAVKRF